MAAVVTIASFICAPCRFRILLVALVLVRLVVLRDAVGDTRAPAQERDASSSAARRSSALCRGASSMISKSRATRGRGCEGLERLCSQCGLFAFLVVLM